MTNCDACAAGTCAQKLSLFDTIVEMAQTPLIPDGEENTYEAGYHDGHVTFARELCEMLGVEVIEREVEPEEESDE